MSRRSLPPKAIRDQIPKRCVRCGTTQDIQYHHNRANVLGGEWTIENTIPVCSKCHYEEEHGIVLSGQMKMLSNHSFLVREGIRKANEQGRRNGRKPADYEAIMQVIIKYSTMFNNEYDADFELRTEHEIADMSGYKYTTYDKAKRMLLEAMQKDVWPYDWPKPVQVRNRPMYDHQIRRMRGEKMGEKTLTL